MKKALFFIAVSAMFACNKEKVCKMCYHTTYAPVNMGGTVQTIGEFCGTPKEIKQYEKENTLTRYNGNVAIDVTMECK